MCLFALVCSDKVLHLHEWHSTYDSRFHGIAEHVPTTLKEGAHITYTTGRRASEMQSHILHVHIGLDNNPFWVLETPTDLKFVDLKSQSFKSSKSLVGTSADDRCPQLDDVSLKLLLPRLIYHVKEKYSATYTTWITDDIFQKLIYVDKVKYCAALSRQSMVSY